MTGVSPIVFIALAAMNALTFALYGIDKSRARRGAWRIRESTLLGTAACFGALGVPALLLVQAVLLAALLFRGR